MNVKKLAKQKADAEKLVADLNQQIAASIAPKLEEAVNLLAAHQEVVSENQAIKNLVSQAVKIVFGDEATVNDYRKIRNRRAHGMEVSSSFDWKILHQLLAKAGVTNEQQGLTKRELEELYFGDAGVKFEHNRWSDKEEKAKWLASDPDTSFKTRKYWSKKKK